MKTRILALALGLTIPTAALANERAYQVLIRNTGTKVGVNAIKNTPCVVMVNNDGVYLNLRGTEFSEGISMNYSQLNKSLISNTVTHSNDTDFACQWLTPGHCDSENSQVEIEFRLDSKTGAIRQVVAIKGNSTTDDCQID